VRTDLIYLPISWCAFQVNAGYGKDVKRMNALRSFCNALPKKNKYFTVVQYDDGILASKENSPIPGIRVFGAGGYGDDPIPLTSDLHPVKENIKKSRFATFYGSLKTHEIRKQMAVELNGKEGFEIEDFHKTTEEYEQITQESLFCLCPRGYGKTSYRLYEVIQMGAVPVYISDERWCPFEQYIDWNDFSVVIKPDMIKELPTLLRLIIDSGEYDKKKENLSKVYNEYFSYEGCFKTIKRILEG
jgi:hypothetical protein